MCESHLTNVAKVGNNSYFMIKWWALRNFSLNLNEKLCLLIFAKSIGPKYLFAQNSRIVLSHLCKDEKKCVKRNCLCYFRKIVSQSNIVSSHFFQQKCPLWFYENCCHSQRCTNCWTIIWCFAKTKNKI